MTCPAVISHHYKAREQAWGYLASRASDTCWRGGGTADGANASAATIAVSGSRFVCRARKVPHSNESVS